MKVLQINSVCKKGSTGKIAYELYKRGNEAGHEFAVCYGRGKKIEEERVFKFGLDLETVFHALMTRLTGYTGCFSPLSTRRLISFIDGFQPDIIHLHEPHAYFLNLKPFFEYLGEKKIPLVYTFHCEFAYTGKCGYSYDCDRFEKGCGNCPRLAEYPKTAGPDHTAAMHKAKKKLLERQNMLIVCPSRWLAERSKRSFLKGFDTRVIKNGIDTENTFYPRSKDEYAHLLKLHGMENEKIVLAVAPSFISDKRKGAEYVLRLARRMTGQNVRFILIGVDAEIEDKPENVIALGRTENQQELAEYYSMADCFVICSEMENLPTTCLEAVCCGTPVVGFDVGGTAETAPEPIGLFGPYGDMDALEKNLLTMLGRSPKQSEFAQFRQEYSSVRMFGEYSKIYKELLGGTDK